MANPNIVNVTSITGKTDVLAVTTSATAITTNSAASNLIYRINSLIISNIDGVNDCDITASIFRSSVDYRIASTVTVPSDATLILISRDMGIYLEEGDAIRLTASANGDIEAVCSYEIIA